MAQEHPSLIDISGETSSDPEVWGPVLISRAEIDREIERLSSIAEPAEGRRATAIVHPSARLPGRGLAPGTAVTIHVLNPGEASTPLRSNASEVEICIGGAGVVSVAGQADFEAALWDVWNLPSSKTYAHRATGDRPFARLTYSNAPILEKLGVHRIEVDPIVEAEAADKEKGGPSVRPRDTAPNIQIPSGAWLRGYEYLVDIDVVQNDANLWPWREVEPHLRAVAGDRPLGMLLLYNPATERRNGTTQNFFSTMTHLKSGVNRPRPERGHRHISSAINYHLLGTGHSIVDGERIEWGPGDLLLSAPGWSEHAHYPNEDEMLVFTVQDHPLHIAMGSLLWQEDMAGPVLNLGAQKGFTSKAPRQGG